MTENIDVPDEPQEFASRTLSCQLIAPRTSAIAIVSVSGPARVARNGVVWDSRPMAGKPIAPATPRERIESEVARRGAAAVADDCIALLRGSTELKYLRSVAGAGANKYFDGKEHHDLYWFRVWALRALLWSWDPRAEPEVCEALSDEAWRVREMAAKVVARHLVGDAGPALAALSDDPVPRVRQAAERARVRLTANGA